MKFKVVAINRNGFIYEGINTNNEYIRLFGYLGGIQKTNNSPITSTEIIKYFKKFKSVKVFKDFFIHDNIIEMLNSGNKENYTLALSLIKLEANGI